MGRPLSPLARGGTFRRRRSADDMAAGGHRRGFDLVDGSILPGSRSVPTDHTVHGFAARLGLARAQWPDHVGARHSGASAMAGLGAVGDRPICRHRTDLQRRRLDGAGLGPALAAVGGGHGTRKKKLNKYQSRWTYPTCIAFGSSRVQTTSNCQAIESTIGPTNRPITPCTRVPPRTPMSMTGIGVLRPLATSGRNMMSSKLTGTM